MQAMTFNKSGIGEVMRIDSSGNMGIGTSAPGAVFRISPRVWSSQPGVLGSWTITTADRDITTWLDQHGHRVSDPAGWPEWSLTQDIYVMFLLRWSEE